MITYLEHCCDLSNNYTGKSSCNGIFKEQLALGQVHQTFDKQSFCVAKKHFTLNTLETRKKLLWELFACNHFEHPKLDP